MIQDASDKSSLDYARLGSTPINAGHLQDLCGGCLHARRVAQRARVNGYMGQTWPAVRLYTALLSSPSDSASTHFSLLKLRNSSPYSARGKWRPRRELSSPTVHSSFHCSRSNSGSQSPVHTRRIFCDIPAGLAPTSWEAGTCQHTQLACTVG